jgi:cytochrome c556
VIRYFAIFLAVGAALAQAPSTPAPTGESAGLKSVGTMKEIMVDLIFPTSNEIFYVGRNEQKSPKDWMDLQQNALIVAEAANLLMADNRARDKDRWMKDAKLLQDVGGKAYKMAKAKDLEGLKGLNDALYEACQSCHEHYRPGYKRRL